jgi:S-formylglutathione hydrolase FrmB
MNSFFSSIVRRVVAGASALIVSFGGLLVAMPVHAACSLQAGKPYRTPSATTVYVITNECQKRPIFNPDVYFSHFASWSDVIFVEDWQLNAIANHPLNFMPWGPRRTFLNGSLIKTVDDPKVYLKLQSNAYPFASEQSFTGLGFSFSQIEDVDPAVLNALTKQSTSLNGATDVPEYTVFKYSGNSSVYLLRKENGAWVKRYITSYEVLKQFYRADHIATLPPSQVYADSSVVDEVADVTAGGGTSTPTNPTTQNPSDLTSVQPGVTHLTITGSVSGKSIDFNIAIPSDYNSSGKQYPVIYWLHGKGGDEKRGATMVNPYFDDAVSDGKISKAIVVYPFGGTSSFYTNDKAGTWPIETMIIKDLIPYVDKHFRTVVDRKARVIMGFSMGGFGALKFASKYPELFAAVNGYAAPALDSALGNSGEAVFGQDAQFFKENTPAYLFDTNTTNIKNNGLKVRLVAGTDDTTRASVDQLHKHLTDMSFSHEYTLLQGATHSVPVYYNLDDGAGFAFLGSVLKANGY